MRTKRLTFRNVMYNALPASYKKAIDDRCLYKKDDFPCVFFYAGYRFTFWAYDLPIEISNY